MRSSPSLPSADPGHPPGTDKLLHTHVAYPLAFGGWKAKRWSRQADPDNHHLTLYFRIRRENPDGWTMHEPQSCGVENHVVNKLPMRDPHTDRKPSLWRRKEMNVGVYIAQSILRKKKAWWIFRTVPPWPWMSRGFFFVNMSMFHFIHPEQVGTANFRLVYHAFHSARQSRGKVNSNIRFIYCGLQSTQWIPTSEVLTAENITN